MENALIETNRAKVSRGSLQQSSVVRLGFRKYEVPTTWLSSPYGARVLPESASVLAN